jgi:predicted methyltransferase
MFNLGYLPLGDKTIVTKPDTTSAGLDQAFEMLRPGGFLSVLAYPGHPGGPEESQCVEGWVAKHEVELRTQRFQDPNNGKSPILWSLTKL